MCLHHRWRAAPAQLAFLAAVFFAAVFFAAAFLAALFLAAVFFAGAFLAAVFFAGFSSGSLGVLAAGGLRGGDRLLERGQQVDDLAGGLGRGLGALDLAALDLRLHQRLDGTGVVVLELGGVEVAGEGLDEHVRHLDLAVLDVAGLDGEVGRADLVGPHHRLQHDHVVLDPQHRDARALAQGDGHHGHPVGVEQRLAQQGVRLGAGALGLEVVGLLEQQRVDLVARHELLDRDLARRRRRQLGHVVVGEDDHLAVLGLVALGDVGVGHLLPVEGADALVLDPAAVLGVHLAERHVVALGRGVELHRHRHQAEGDCALPDRSHEVSMSHASHARHQGRRRPDRRRVVPRGEVGRRADARRRARQARIAPG